jgi:membrane protease YdiL (CAAX protease family)
MTRTLLRVAAFFVAYNLIMFLASIPKGMAPRLAADLVWGGLASLGTYALTAFLLSREQRTRQELGLLPDRLSLPRLIGGLAIGLAVWGAQMAVISGTLGPIYVESTAAPHITVWLSVIAGFLALSAMEELGFRAYPLRTLIPVIGEWPAQFAVAALFGLWHLVFGWPWQTVLLGVVPSGLLFGVMLSRSNGLAMPIGLHAALNIGLWSVGGKELPGVWTLNTAPEHTAQVEAYAPLVGMAVTLLATAVIARWPVRRR